MSVLKIGIIFNFKRKTFFHREIVYEFLGVIFTILKDGDKNPMNVQNQICNMRLFQSMMRNDYIKI